jgi:tetratricopeptide (TPR) repeat protein
MFLEKRVNQGTSGRVYPNPFTDGFSNESEEREYRAVFLENEYVRLMMLPQIGGRIHEGVDKTNGYHFIYRQHVIKPALIGLFGSWISGGVEFNWPQHHRPSTFMPVHHAIEKGVDGSLTVWLSEHDPMDRLKGMVGICLYPDKAYVEFKVQLYNRTPFAQTFLWWVNVGVHVHDRYQVFFPPDVTVVTDHSKRSMARFPVPHDTYYDIDYGEGVDVSWPTNIPVPTSYFVYESGEDFFGGYDHARDAGLIHVANHHISPGKKMFTWGAGDFGAGWERNLTDADGPYIELMAGVYTDNQPDFSWLQPYETKTFRQYWYPFQEIGPAQAANRRVAASLRIEGERVKVGVAATEALPGAVVQLTASGEPLTEQGADLSPGAPFVAETELPDGVRRTDLLLCVSDCAGVELIRYAAGTVEHDALPEPQVPPPPPETFDSIEELYLTGLHLGQYRHPTIEPEPYWEAALQRDPSDVRSNNAMGLVHLRRGQYPQAEAHFRRAIETLTRRNPNPRDGEPYYNLGLTLRWQDRYEDAYAAFFKAIWSYAWQAAGYYALAEIDCLRGDYARALDHLDRSLVTNALNCKARNLQAAALRRLGLYDKAATLARGTLELDRLDMWSRNEQVLLSRERGRTEEAVVELAELTDLMGVSDPLVEIQNYLDMAFDYANAGLWVEASDILSRLVERDGDGATAYPMVLYALGHYAHRRGREKTAQGHYRRASAMSTDYCFPVRLEELAILEHARSVDPQDARVAYYLGNLYYDKRRYDEAIQSWERSVELQPDRSIPWRNLGIATYNVRHDAGRAIDCYRRAFAVNPEDGRVLSELDQLARRVGSGPEERLALLEEHLELVVARDDLSLELATLYNQTGQPEKALDLFRSRRFHPWEGGTGRVSAQYVKAHLLVGQSALEAGRADEALAHFQAAEINPDNLGEGRHLLWPDAHIHYYAGLALAALGQQDKARVRFQRILETKDHLSETTYYQALALRQLGDEDGARARLQHMLAEGTRVRDEEAQRAFATSVPEFVFAEEDRETRMRLRYTYLIGLAHLGLGQTAQAEAAFRAVLAQDPNHLDALEQLRRSTVE